MSLRVMIQGTTSDAGKSTLATALCRALKRRGWRVAPFKPQNMALNSAVTIDGGEIGRAQALQAFAAGLEPHTDMNPVLLKPTTDMGAQVIIHGHAIGNMRAHEYHQYKPQAMQAVMASFARLSAQYDALVVEGAGSPAEINLRANDIANMGFAEAADCPVLLVADIDRGGVFAHIVGTLALLSERERARVLGFVINRFRGDIALLRPGLEWLTRETGKPVLGVLPYLPDLLLDAEDGASLKHAGSRHTARDLRIVVPALPRISNYTDFDPLRAHPRVDLRFVTSPGEICGADLIILPGSKSVRQDLAWLRAQGWEHAIQRHLRYGGKVLGICGGLQMLGLSIADPLGLEGNVGVSTGLGLLDIRTTLASQKQLQRVYGELLLDGAPVSGYEIHMGVSVGDALKRPTTRLADRNDGALSDDNQIFATYVHGIFDHASACAAILRWAGLETTEGEDRNTARTRHIEDLTDALERALDVNALITHLQEFQRKNAIEAAL